MSPEDNSTSMRSRVALSTPALRLEADPACGGKLRSLVSLRSGREYFYQDTRPAFDKTNGYSYHDISGYDECFPTVAGCCGRTPAGDAYDYADHGSLWQASWEVREDGGTLDMTGEASDVGCTMFRCCSFPAEDTLRLDYRVRNLGRTPVPFVYSAHPLLAANEHTRVVLPREMMRAFCYLATPNFGLSDGEWFDLPCVVQQDLVGPFSLGRRTFAKLFCDRLHQGRAAIEYPDSGERLVFTFDTATLPHLGLLAAQSYDSLGDGHFAGEFLLALEPTTGIGDDLSTCLQTGTLQTLAPCAEFAFWICISLEPLE